MSKRADMKLSLIWLLIVLTLSAALVYSGEISTSILPDLGYVDDQDGNDEEGGDYTKTQIYDGPQTSNGDDYYYIVGEGSKNDNALSYIVLNYDMDPLNVSVSEITNLEFTIYYCHSGESSPTKDLCDNDDPIEKTIDGAQNVEVYDFVNSQWVDVGDHHAR